MTAPTWPDVIVARLSAADLLADDDALSPRQMAVLALSCHPQDALRTIRGMADAMGVGRPAVSRAIDRLEVLGLVRRRADRNDLRSKHANATERGRRRALEIAAMLDLNTKEEPSA